VVEVSDLARGGVGVGGADELPQPAVDVVTDEQDRVATLEDFEDLDAVGAQQSMPHPPGSSVAFHDAVDDPPYERQVLVRPRHIGAQVRPALGHLLERLVNQREGVIVLGGRPPAHLARQS
jgi:hypothetical protein